MLLGPRKLDFFKKLANFAEHPTKGLFATFWHFWRQFSPEKNGYSPLKIMKTIFIILVIIVIIFVKIDNSSSKSSAKGRQAFVDESFCCWNNQCWLKESQELQTYAMNQHNSPNKGTRETIIFWRLDSSDQLLQQLARRHCMQMDGLCAASASVRWATTPLHECQSFF